jgi:spermidine synthase
MLWLLFFASGVTALIFASVWSRYLALWLGGTMQTQTLALALFLGGLALGHWLFGRWADRLRRPLVWFGYVEVLVGLYAFFFEGIQGWAEEVFAALGVMVLGHEALMLLLKVSISGALLLGPTLLMGGSLPLVAAWLQRHGYEPSREVARLYAVGGFGAAAGAWLGSLFLPAWIGLSSAAQMTALLNVVIGFGVAALARRRGGGSKPGPAPAAVAPGVEAEHPVALGWACALVALTSAVAVGLAELTARSFSLMLGASAPVLMSVVLAYLLGTAVGSAVVSSPFLRAIRRERATHFVLVAAACVIGIVLARLEQTAAVYWALRSGLASTEMGYRFHGLLAGGMAVLVLSVPAGLLGAVLPLWLRAETGPAPTLGRRVSRLLTWNALGAVAGLLLTSLVLMPRLGLRASYGVLAVGLCVAAVPTAFMTARPRAILVSTGVVALLVIGSQSGGEGWRQVLTAELFRPRAADSHPAMLAHRREHVRLLFYEDALEGTVSVEQSAGRGGAEETRLRLNGQVWASARNDLARQYLLAHLPMLARPASEDVLVIGLDSGITTGALLGHPVQRVDVAEGCEPVVRAARAFDAVNRGALTNNRVRVWREEGRTFLKLTPQRYDVIVNGPTAPWMAGGGARFSREFYELAARRLKERGLVAQWFPVDEISDAAATLVLATFGSVFPFFEIWDAGRGDLILLGSQRPWSSSQGDWEQVFAREQPRYDLQRIGLRTPALVWARQLASTRTAFAIAGTEPPYETDRFPWLEATARKALFLDSLAGGLFGYDERTWQSALAEPAKRAALAGLEREELRAVFAEFGTINAELDRYLRLRLSARAGAGPVEFTVGGEVMPCVFQPAEWWPPLPVEVAAANDDHTQLRLAEALIHTAPGQWSEGVQTIERILRRTLDAANPERPAWSPGHFLVVAVRTALGQGQPERAGELLALTERLERQPPELRYLFRLWRRATEGGPPAR